MDEFDERSQRIKAGAFANVLDIADTVFSYPQRKLKEAVSGDEEQWFTDYQQPTGTAFSNLGLRETPITEEQAEAALNWGVDPAGFLGAIGSKGGKALSGVIGSLDDYIPNWYGPRRKEPNAVEEALLSPVPEEHRANVRSGALKGLGVAGWALGQAGHGLAHLVSPQSRALWDKKGITIPAQNRVANYASQVDAANALTKQQQTLNRALKKGEIDADTHARLSDDIQSQRAELESRADSMGVAAMNYPTHIAHQRSGGPPENLPESVKNVVDKSNIQGYTPYSEANVKSALLDYKATRNGVEGQVLTDAEADYMASWFNRPQEMKDTKTFVVKAPKAKESGGHHRDVVYTNPANGAITDVFKKHMDADGNVNIDTLYASLKEKQGLDKYKNANPKNTWRVANPSLEDVRENGLYLTGGKVGSAIVEGGVSWLMKVEPDGTLKAIMRDKHDFAEKLPGLGAAAKAGTPNDLSAVSPPMIDNIKTIKQGITGDVVDAQGNTLFEPPKVLKSGKLSTRKKPQQQTQHAAPFTLPGAGQGVDKSWPQLFSDYVAEAPDRADTLRAGGTMFSELMLGNYLARQSNREENQ